MIFIILFSVVLLVALFWVKGIDDMAQNHPDYKGEDMFNENNLKDERLSQTTFQRRQQD